ncbi:hypothetical protein BX600DRAFT_428520 [Xylariales sp. PMI_506]|nr:hypothetical protein BX600DRAFT_428520 [Xylariales sp. PMI_506]
MSRNATASPVGSRPRGPLSHLRQLSRTSLDKVATEGPRSPDTVSSASTIREAPAQSRLAERICTVSINELVIGEEVLLNLDLLGGSIKPGTLMSITPVKPDLDRRTTSNHGTARPNSYYRHLSGTEDTLKLEGDAAKRYVFVVKDMTKEARARNPNVEILVPKHVGDAFGMRRGTQVVLAPVDAVSPAIEASHVDLSFRDMYLSRADMWQLAVAELADKTVYKGQVIYFMGTIKATVSTVFVEGRKVHSAFFSHNTRPIFRSESARYVLFIQISREMWEFDSDDSGEIMFFKVVNGFLPALFKKWIQLQVKHLVTIVLFARVEYDTGLAVDLADSTVLNDYYTGFQSSGEKRPYKDFYRVVVSEMSSGEWTTILHQLKLEFSNFRKDIGLYHFSAMGEPTDLEDDASTHHSPSSGIRAQSSLAMYGNFLEAINLAASQFAHDYIDRDLLRTGISIAVISAGSGVFEVEYENLRRTTEALIGNGIGIDLICIPKIPLHSVPLFRYRNPHFLEASHGSHARSVRSRDSTPKQPTPLVGSYTTIGESMSPTKLADVVGRVDPLTRLYTDEWAFALPQWLHVSYWTGRSEEALSYHGISLSALDHSNIGSQDEFIIRCRLYALQMRSVLETNEIETTPLHADPEYPYRDIVRAKSGKPHSEHDHSSLTIQKPKVVEPLFEPVYGFQRFNPDKLSRNGESSVWKQLQAFDEYRSKLPKTRNVLPTVKSTRELDEATRKQLAEDTGLFGSSVGDKKLLVPSTGLPSSLASQRTVDTAHSEVGGSSRRNSTAASLHPKSASSAKLPKFMRQISLGQRGFGIAAPKAATAQLQAENVNATNPGQRTPTPTRTTPATPKRPAAGPTSPRVVPSQGSIRSFDQATSELSDQFLNLANTPSRPIHIRPSISAMDSMSQLKAGSIMATGSILAAPAARSIRSQEDRDLKFSNILRAEDAQKLYNSKLLAGALPELPSTLSPTTALAPWLVLLNPSNPDMSKVDDSALYNRWQHVFPRPSDMRVMKWKSLSSPAAVPLTTEHFPTKAQFDTEYQRQPYTIAQNVDDELLEEPKSREAFLRELISARFAHGFQVVIGPSVARAFGQKLLKIADIFSRDRMVEDGTSLFMSIGNTIHQLSCVNGTEVEVNIFVRKPTESFMPADQPPALYKTAIRTYLEPGYEEREIDLVTPKMDKNWNYIDSYLAGHFEDMSENLRFWRTRFVLIPMSSRNSSNSQTHAGDDEEEVRIEGIHKLMQAWQRYRYVPPSERHFQSAGRRARGTAPLDIVYKTEDPSVVIAAELETLPLLESSEVTTRKGHLISNKERFSKSNFNLSALAEAIQQPVENGGIRMQNRRWHLRLHYNCFIGSDMTTWLLDNFEDLESREEAVELGNSLMVYDDERTRDKDKKDRDRGIFVHVERRHAFRDGQYFYQIVSEYSKTHGSGWLHVRKRDMISVPSTPLVEAARDSAHFGAGGGMSRPTSIHEDASPISGAVTPTLPLPSGKKPKVYLSKVMKYDVDHRKKSYRSERINLHYDRLHNPDNCYHIRIDWMSVTAKLIEDAVKGWASTATSHGLRLVEVPIAEACSITETTPFRKPYLIKLCVPPPSERPRTYFEPNTFTPLSQPGKHFYQKALLRKFDYVLDTEAASEFPSNVDVNYSWGKPNFKFTQYIHRSGILLVEITDDGNFIILANRLYSNRAIAVQPTAVRPEPPQNERVARLMSSAGYASYGLSEPTPIASPLFRPALFSAAQSSSRDAPPLVHMSPRLTATRTGLPHPSVVNGGAVDALKDALESFCSNPKELTKFYKDTLEKKAVSSPATSAQSDGVPIPDSSIPSFGLPPGVLGSTSSPRVGTPTLSGSLLLRRGSVQH